MNFISPKLPVGCEIKSLKGIMNWMENGASSLSVTLSGQTCVNFLESLRSVPIEIIFSNVPHQLGNLKTNTLLLKITEMP